MSDEVEVLPPAVEPVGYHELELALTGNANLEERDPTETSMAIVRRVLEAKTLADVLADDQVMHARDILGQSFIAVGVHWNRSTMGGDGPTVYAVIDATNDDGERLTVTCGGVRVMAQLARIGELDAFPTRVKILEAKTPTASGYYPLRLVAG